MCTGWNWPLRANPLTGFIFKRGEPLSGFGKECDTGNKPGIFLRLP
jgi:hypothetical protein